MTVHALKHGLALCGSGGPTNWPAGDRWVSFIDPEAHELTTCPGCLDALGPRQVGKIYLTSAALLPEIDHAAPVVRRLAAMARPPQWVIDITSGRPNNAYAAGDELPLMDAALRGRGTPLFSQGGDAMEVYTAALDARWSELVAQGAFAPGVWRYMTYERATRPDGFLGPARAVEDGRTREVPTECYVVCTCRAHEGCHLRILARHLVRAGWNVTLYGAPVAP